MKSMWLQIEKNIVKRFTEVIQYVLDHLCEHIATLFWMPKCFELVDMKLVILRFIIGFSPSELVPN